MHKCVVYNAQPAEDASAKGGKGGTDAGENLDEYTIHTLIMYVRGERRAEEGKLPMP
jgi:hypothetical protein